MSEQVYSNACLVCENEEVFGTLVVRDGRIAEIGIGSVASGIDCEGAYLLPGLVELHTDTLEKCLLPRPGVHWPQAAALLWHDRNLSGAGITTACSAIALRDVPNQPLQTEAISPVVAAITNGLRSGQLKVDHRLHFRCEVSTLSAPDVLQAHLNNPLLAVVSIMDHTPGQRQFVAFDAFRAYYRNRYNLTDRELDEYTARLLAIDASVVRQQKARISQLARTRHLCLSTHDDATESHITEAVVLQARVSEFPTTEKAALAAKNKGLQVLMGAPNAVLGRSHSGNLSTRQAARLGALDILSSDYAPPSLLHAVFTLAEMEGGSLPAAVRTVTAHPAAVIGLLADRGTLTVGKRADFLVVRLIEAIPVLQAVYRNGLRIA